MYPGRGVDEDIVSRLTNPVPLPPLGQLAAAYGHTAIEADRLGLDPADMWTSTPPPLDAPGIEAAIAEPAFPPMGLGF